jgi:hypothetical protein
MLLSSNLQLRIGSTKRGPTSVPSLSKSRPHVNRKFLCAQPRALLACACLPEQEKGPATDAGPMSLQVCKARIPCHTCAHIHKNACYALLPIYCTGQRQGGPGGPLKVQVRLCSYYCEGRWKLACGPAQLAHTHTHTHAHTHTHTHT